MTEDREHIVNMNLAETNRFRAWLDRPNGAFSIGRVTFEAWENGGIWVRTKPFRAGVDHA